MSAPGAHERHIARSTLVQQAAQVYAVLAMLVVVTLVARTVTRDEFGLYGLMVSVSTYVVFLQGSVSNATVRAIAGAVDAGARDRVYSAAVAIYAGAGLVAGLAIVLFGLLAAAALGIPADLVGDARAAAVAMALATALGWPSKVFEDGLRGLQRFGAAALSQVVAYTVVLAGTALLLVLDAPLWALIALGASLPVLTGLGAALVASVTRLRLRFRARLIAGAEVRSLLGVSAYLWSAGLADVVISSLDRAVLLGFRSIGTVGLYEGAARPHTLVRQLHATLALTVVPVASGYLATGDDLRLRELLVRGTRYVMAIVVPVTVVLMTLSDRILEVWLGAQFVAAAPAMAILLSYWIVQSGTGVAGGMLVAAGHVRELNRYAWMVAVTNLALSLVLTALFGLEGVVIGTALPYVLFLPYLVRLTLRVFPVAFGLLVREACVPAFATGAVAAAVVALARSIAPLDDVITLALTAGAALAVAWGVYAAVWLRPAERRLVRSLLRSRA